MASRFSFRRIRQGEWPPEQVPADTIYLQQNNWDDYHFRTTFNVFVRNPSDGSALHVGATKIAPSSMELNTGKVAATYTELPNRFTEVEPGVVSVGQDRDFYTQLRDALGLTNARAMLAALHDVTLNLERLNVLLEHSDVVKTSLFRSVSVESVRSQFVRILNGSGGDTEAFSMTYIPEIERGSDAGQSNRIVFAVSPGRYIPTNLHAVIGANGVGKTTAIHRIRDGLRELRHDGRESPHLQLSDAERISSLLTVSFSAFDLSPARFDVDRPDFRIVDIALATQSLPGEEQSPLDLRTTDGQTEQFQENLRACLVDREERLLRATRVLALADQGLERFDIASVEGLQALPYGDLSSGHKIVLLAVTALVRYCEERTLVLIDEPEAHLHPPLLSAFTRVISELVTDRNSLGVITTHSPVVLQEVPRACAWIIWRLGTQLRVLHPTINTFGESVDVLTREVFGLELREAGYYTLLEAAAREHGDYESAVQAFGGELGSSARLVLRTLMNSDRNRNS